MALDSVSSRTRRRKSAFPLPPPPHSDGVDAGAPLSSSTAVVCGGTSACTDAAAAAPSGPMARQREKEDKWRAKLSRQTTWWDSASAALENGAIKADMHLGVATRATRAASEGSLRILVRGRNHAKADVRQMTSWRDTEVDRFLGCESAPKPTSAPAAPAQPPSPNHFERRYGIPRRRPLPPLRLETRDKLAQGTAVAREREARNAQARASAFRSDQ